MRLLKPSLCVLASLLVMPANLYACAVPKPLFYSVHAAEAIVRGTITSFEAADPEYARLTFDVIESLRGDIPLGPLSVQWKRPPERKQSDFPETVILALERIKSPLGDQYQIMSGCMVQGIYSASETQLVMQILSKLGQ